MKFQKNKVGLIIVLLIGFSQTLAYSQSTWNLPTNRKNVRFTTDQFNIPRPALSMRGFDNTQSNYQNQYSSTTFGVRQVLEQAYGIDMSKVSSVEIVYQKIINRSQKSFRTLNDSNAEFNSSILESMAFVALMSYVIQENQNLFTGKEGIYPNMPNHSTARNDFINALEGKGDFIREVSKTEAFKRSRTLMKVSRAWDLYLALENAYDDLGGNFSYLLNESDKQWWNNYIYEELKELWQQSNDDVPWAGWASDVQLHEAQAGNWPLISFVAAGYVALGFNGPFQAISDADDYLIYHDLDSILGRAMKSTAFHYTDTGNKRYNYWWYQTGEGQPFWAEGAYYFEVALPRVLEFWHTIRANDMLDFSSHGDGIDPFNYNKFINPLDWHANISTPDGNTPPFDDGNKKAIKSSILMSWNSNYGDLNLGKKYAYLRDLSEIGGIGSNANHRLVEIAIPRLSSGEGTPPPNSYGNFSSSSLDEQQLINKKTDLQGNEHYFFLNGENGNAITRGEGHEQADQLQLLYYYDGGSEEKSYLMDTGYDRATGTTNSNWNIYRLQNVLSVDNATNGGIIAPYLNPGKTRKVSQHASVNYLYEEDHGPISILKGQVDIKHYNTTGQHIYTTQNSRNLLLVGKDETNSIDFYAIDIASNDNRPLSISSSEVIRHDVHMRYYSDTQSYSHQPLGWSRFEHGSKDLYLYQKPVEWKLHDDYANYYTINYLAREENRRDIGSDQEGYYVSYRGLGDVYNEYSKSWNFVSIFSASTTQPSYTPTEVISYADDNYARTSQAWAYQHTNDVIDVVIKRAKSKEDSNYNSAIAFNVSAANDIDLELPSGKDYGFVRLVNTSIGWEIDDDYQINLERGTPTATLSGPGILFEGQEGTWQASATGGVPPYSYTWFLQPQGSSSPSPIGTGSSISYTARDPFYISVEAEDANSKTDHSPAHYVKITGFHHKKLADSAKVPDEFLANPNYPNPFNPSTTIKYGVPEQADVTLNVYNILGQNVATLVNETKAAGYYSVRFDASSLASGFYIARITAEGVSGEHFVDEQKMQLIK